METDRLLSLAKDTSQAEIDSQKHQKEHRCVILSTWVLIVAIAFLSSVMIVDIRLRRVDGHDNISGSDSISTNVVESDSISDDADKVSTARRYHATQFLSFTINTLGGLADKGECEERSVDPKSNTCYLGDDDVEKDMNHRLKILEGVLSILRNDVFDEEPEIDRDPGVLKILMMPEFLLRGPNGAYSTSQMYDSSNDEEDGILIEFADKMRDLIYDSAFEDYLFVLGTVIVAESNHAANNEKDSLLNANDITYFNFSPVYRGGEDRVGSNQHIVLKKYISNADFLSRTTLPNPSDFDMHSYGKKDDSKLLSETFAKRNLTVVTDNYLEIDGIKIGFEICLDHRMGALWDNLRMKHDSQLVDVQLITSAGMSIERGPNPLKHGGVVYLTDGEGSSAACIRTDTAQVFDPNNVCRGSPDSIQHRPHGGPGYSGFVGLSGCIDMEKSNLLKGYYSMYQPQGCANTLKTYGIDVMDEFKYYPPSIEIYPTIELPDNK